MFFHIFAYRLRCILRDRATIFWSSMFPLILATLFGLALSNISATDSFARIPLAVVENDAYRGSPAFREALASAAGGESPLFEITFVPAEADALSRVESGDATGAMVLNAGEEIELHFKSSGLKETIIQSFADTYEQMSDAYRTLLRENPAAFGALLAGDVYRATPMRDKLSGAAYPDNVATYYFALIAMACLYGGFQGLSAISVSQANQSALAARNNLAPVSTLTVSGASLSAAFAVQFALVLLLIAYIKFGIGVSFGNRLFHIVLTSALGTALGICFGALVGALLKKREGTKIAVLLSVSMVLSFLSGLMFGDMKYIVQKHAPILSILNPANLIADGFYSLYYYETLDRYARNMWLLMLFTAILFGAVFLIMRRQKYASL